VVGLSQLSIADEQTYTRIDEFIFGILVIQAVSGGICHTL
jgi:hypothetical protein